MGEYLRRNYQRLRITELHLKTDAVVDFQTTRDHIQWLTLRSGVAANLFSGPAESRDGIRM